MKKINIPELYKDYKIKEVIKATAPNVNIKLSDNSVINLDGELGILKEIDSYLLIKGKAHFRIIKNPWRKFRVINRAGKIEVLGTDFVLDVKEEKISEKSKTHKIGDNPSKLSLQVNNGKVSFLGFGQKIPKIFKY